MTTLKVDGDAGAVQAMPSDLSGSDKSTGDGDAGAVLTD